MTQPTLEVIVADDELAVRRGIELLLSDAGLRVVGAAATVTETHTLLTRRRYDVALLELSLEDESTLPLVGELLASRASAPFVLYAGRTVPTATLEAASALQMPGFVLKGSSPATLLEALRRVAAGGRFIDPELARLLPDSRARTRRFGLELLSPREREVLALLADGHSGADIAVDLFLSAETVRTHVRNAVQKLGARTRTQAVAMFVAGGGAVPIPVFAD
jgi:DNA-binding NarL/FixJ family response regulator